MRVKFISKEELLEMIENKDDFRLVDVLSKDSYKEGHLPFAVNIPADKIEEMAPKMLPDKNATVIVYCASFTCEASSGAARELMKMGYKNVLDYKGGKSDWQKADLPLVKD